MEMEMEELKRERDFAQSQLNELRKKVKEDHHVSIKTYAHIQITHHEGNTTNSVLVGFNRPDTCDILELLYFLFRKPIHLHHLAKWLNALLFRIHHLNLGKGHMAG